MRCKLFSVVKDTIVLLVAVALTVGISLCLPILFSILWPLYFLRFLAAIFGKLLIKDFVKLLPPLDCTALEEKTNIIFTVFLEGDLTLENARQLFLKKVLKCKDEHGQPKYPEFQQKIASFFGFCYWRRDKNFSVENHIKYFNPKDQNNHEILSSVEMGKEKLEEISKILTHTPFKKEQSPWEIYLIRNFSLKDSEELTNCSVVIFKFCHGMLDFYSFVKFLYCGIGGMTEDCDMETTLNTPFKDNSHSRAKIALKLFFAINTLIFNRIYRASTFFDRNEWHPRNSKIHRMFHVCSTQNISVKTVEEISMTHKIPQFEVILAGITGGIRQTMFKGNITPPDEIRVVYPMYLEEKRTQLLSNKFTLASIQLPTGKADPIARLLAIQEATKDIDRKGFPLLLKTFFKINGGLFHKLTSGFAKCNVATMAFNTVVFPNDKFTLFDTKIIRMQSLPVLQNGDFGVLATIVRFKDTWQLSLLIHCSLLSTAAEVEEFGHFIQEEFHLLETYKRGSRHSKKKSVFSLAEVFDATSSSSNIDINY